MAATETGPGGAPWTALAAGERRSPMNESVTDWVRHGAALLRRLAFAMAGVLVAGAATADTYIIPANGDNVVGAVSTVVARHEDTFSDIAIRHGQGFLDMRLANPGVDAWLPGEGTTVVIPSLYILPDAPREGIVINVPEMRLYFYPKPKPGEAQVVVTHPISIGRQEWTTPHGLTKVTTKVKDPAWYPPESIRKEHAERGDILPRVVPAGPDNPLGRHSLRLGLPSYLIHGTNKPFGVGMRVTHGCIRLYPDDIERLFEQVSVGTPVRIINQPYKIGRLNGELFVEAHPPLEEDHERFRDVFTHIVGLIVKTTQPQSHQIDWNRLQDLVARSSGIPVAVGSEIVLREADAGGAVRGSDAEVPAMF